MHFTLCGKEISREGTKLGKMDHFGGGKWERGSMGTVVVVGIQAAACVEV